MYPFFSFPFIQFSTRNVCLSAQLNGFLFIAIQAQDNGQNQRQTMHNNSLESDTATARRWRCPEHLCPCASSGNALCDSRRAVSHELRVTFIDYLRNNETTHEN